MNYLSQLASAGGGVLQGDDSRFTHLSTDTRKIKPGDVFVALRGDRFDGHDYISQACDKGAIAVICDHPIEKLDIPQIIVADTTKAFGAIAAAYRKAFGGVVIGVTGSGGKTTVKGMLKHILQRQGTTLSSAGNFNNHIGVPLTLIELAQQQYAVVEMGTSSPGEIRYLTSLVEPDIALVNNVMPAHIGGFGSLQAIADEKAAIYGKLTGSQLAVINANDRFAKQFIAQTAQCRQLLFSVEPSQSEFQGLVAENLQADAVGCYRFQLRNEHDSVDVALAVLGRHMVDNALAAASCAFAVGCTLQDISMGLATYRGEAGRMQAHAGPGNSRLIDDSYNANPGSVKVAIEHLSQCAGKRILVLGDLGELGETALDAHKQIGEYALQNGIDALYAVGEAATLAAVSFGESGLSFTDQDSLGKALLSVLDAETTVLVKGSRSSKMDRVCDFLLNNDEDSSTC